MNVLNYTETRRQLTRVMEAVCDNHEPIIIKRGPKKRDIVMISLEDYQAMEETFYLLRSPKNASRLRESIENDRQELIKEKALILE